MALGVEVTEHRGKPRVAFAPSRLGSGGAHQVCGAEEVIGHRRDLLLHPIRSDVHHGIAQRGEVEGLRGGVKGDRASRGEQGHRSVGPSRVDEIGMDLVADHQQVVTLGQVGQRRQFVVGEHVPGRVVGVTQKKHPRPFLLQARVEGIMVEGPSTRRLR